MKCFLAKLRDQALPSSSPVSTLLERLSVIGAMLCQVILLIVAAVNNRYLLQFDMVCYIRIASYYASGQTDLMVSGYWGPLLSWLIVIFLGLVENQLDAARIVMGISAVVFLLGCISVFRSFRLPPAGVVIGTWIAAAASIRWSLIMNPDLLMSGLLALGISRMISPQWIKKISTQWTVGLLWGVAYLAKAVAFPITFGLAISIGALWVISREASITRVTRNLAITILGFLLIAGPWVVVLSSKYKHLTFSTSAKINHAIVGPPDIDREYPLRTFNPPLPGRLTSWEDPSSMPNISSIYWSPFESLEYAQHQLRVIYQNSYTVLYKLRDFDFLGIGLFALVCGFLLHKSWRQNLKTERWRWAGILVAVLAGVYLPVVATSQRYYFPVYPFLIAASVGAVGWLTQNTRPEIKMPGLIGLCLVLWAFATPTIIQLPRAFKGLDHSSLYAHKLAQKLQASNIYGPLAGVHHEGGDESLFVAFFINQPWYGAELRPTLQRLKMSHANLIIVHRKSLLTPELDRDPAFLNLDNVLFESEKEAVQFPLQAYQLLSTSS